MKLLASHLGGTRNPMAVRWPAKIKPDADAAHPVPPLQRRRPDDLRDRRHHPAAGGQRRPAGPDRRRQLRLHLRRPDAPGPAAHPVLRDHGQPRDLPRRLDGLGVRAAPALGPGPAARHPDWTPDQDDVGALQPRRGLVAGQRPRRRDAGEARPDEGAVRDRGGQEQRLPDRRRALGRPSSTPSCGSRRRTTSGTSPATSSGCRSSARRRSATSQPRHHRRRHPGRTPTACSTRSAAPAAASPASSTTASSATSTTSSSSSAPRSASEQQAPVGQGQDRGRDRVRRGQAGWPAQHHA